MKVKSNDYVSKEEFYKLCRISKKTAYKLIKSGRIKAIKRDCGSLHCYEIPISEIERIESIRYYINKLREEEIGKVVRPQHWLANDKSQDKSLPFQPQYEYFW